MEILLYFALVAQAVTFLLMFRRPAWAVVSLIIGQFTTCNYMMVIGEQAISARFLWTVLVLLFLLPVLVRRRSKLGKKGGLLLASACFFFIWTLIANLVNTDLTTTFNWLRQMLTALTLVLIIPLLIKDKKDIMLLLVAALIVGAVSAFVAMMQHYSFLGFPVLTLTPNLLEEGRAVGMTYSAVHLAYGLPIILVVMFAYYLIAKPSPRTRWWLIVLALLIGAALYWTFTRSGALALGVGALAVILLGFKRERKAELLLGLLLVIGVFFLYISVTQSRYDPGVEAEGSAAARAVLWPAAIEIAQDNPVFGIGYDLFNEEAVNYYYVVSGTYDDQLVTYALGGLQPHNDFLMIWVSFGTPALIAFAAFFIGISLSLYRSFIRTSDPLLKAVSLGLIGAIPAYIANAANHNMMESVFFIWIIGGLAIALARIISTNNPKGRVPRAAPVGE